MHQFLLLGIFIFVPAIAVAATPHGQAAAHWSSQAACEMATQEKCTQDGAKAWHGTGASSRQAVPPVSKPATVPAAPVAVSPNVKPVQAESPPPPAPTEAAKPNEGFFTNLFGNKNAPTPAEQKRAAPAASSSREAKPLPLPSPPELERKPLDPEIVLRGKVWASEAACKKDALKGKCSSIDCATHSGGACSGYTSMIWIYR